MNILGLFGLVRRSEVDPELASLRALNTEFKRSLTLAYERLDELSRENERIKIRHDTLAEQYETDKRCHAKLAQALGSRTTQPFTQR